MHSVSDSLALIPYPQDVALGELLVERAATTITFPAGVDEYVSARAHELLADLQLGPLSITIEVPARTFPELQADESYQLEINTEGIALTAANGRGALHGVSTLWQLSQQDDLPLASMQINDHPRFAWRGVLIDVARHFIGLPTLLQVIEGMARLKMNVLHLHLSDDQGFRFPSKTFPKLASVEHYTAEQLHQLVRFAAARGIRVVPELDIPGHLTSWLVAYPEWGLKQVAPTAKFGVHKACLNPIDESVYAALDKLFDEVVAIFPDDYLHIGGDEVHPAWWREDVEIQTFITTQNLGDERGLQAYFNKRIVTLLAAKGRRVVAWDEVLHEHMPDLVVQNWRGATTRDRALQRSLDCIVSAGFYLDLCYPADVHLRYDPAASQAELMAQEDALRQDLRLQHVAEGLAWTQQWRANALELKTPAVQGNVLGGEACLWGELVDTPTLSVRLFSRLPAVAECLWGKPTSKLDEQQVQDFYARMAKVHEMPGFELGRQQTQALQRIGLDAQQSLIAALLEPVKWYARLLGEQALNARLMGEEMPQARPYDVTSPLNDVVDFLAPESLPARQFRVLPQAALLAHAHRWQRLTPLGWPEDMQPVITAFAALGDLLAAHLQAAPHGLAPLRDALLALYVPHGEYLLAVVPALLQRDDAVDES